MSGWASVPLSDVCVRGDTVNPRKTPDVEFEYVDVSAVSNEAFEIVESNRLQGKDAPSRARRKIIESDVIFATVRPTLQRIAQVPKELDGQVCSTGFIVLRAGPKLDARYLFYSLFRAEFMDAMEELQGGASYPAVTDKQVLSQEIPLPPLEEQKRIVAVLDQAFAALERARANAEANLADAEELFENTLETVFQELASNAQTCKLADAVHPDCKLSYGIVQPGDEVHSGLPIVRPVDLKSRRITKQGLKRISPAKAGGYARTTLTGAELLLCVRGSTGEVSMTTAELEGANVTRGIVPIRFEREKVDLDFAYFQMRSPFARKQVAEKTYGAALMQINIKDLRALEFVLPSLEVQRQTTAKVEKLFSQADALKAKYQADLGDLEDLRQSILRKAFAGELT